MLQGSLHMDTCDAHTGAEVECLVVARALKPAVGSALSDPQVGPRDLFWVIHVVDSERDGIVERRGIGQVLLNCFDGETMAEVKLVSLG